MVEEEKNIFPLPSICKAKPKERGIVHWARLMLGKHSLGELRRL